MLSIIKTMSPIWIHAIFLCSLIIVLTFPLSASAQYYDPVPIELTSQQPPLTGYFGVGVTGVPDLNGDGAGDVAVMSAPSFGLFDVFDGHSGAFLRNIPNPFPECQYSGGRFSISGLTDVNGDGLGDVLVGGDQMNCHQAYVYDGATGARLHTLYSPNETMVRRFGDSVSGIPDVNGDGVMDCLVGAPNDTSGTSPEGAGRAYIFDGATGLLLRTFTAPEEHLSYSFGLYVSGIEDIDGDGRGDAMIAVGAAPWAVFVFSGATGSLLHTLSFNNENIAVPAGIPDITGDEVPDLAVGRTWENLEPVRN